MKLVIKKKLGPFGRFELFREMELGPKKGQKLSLTPARHALELEHRLNGGISVYQADVVCARTGQHSAPIFRVDVLNDSGARLL